MNEKISNFAQVASLRRYTLTEGKGAGLDVIDCDNGKIRFLLNVSKACDVMQLYHEGQNVSFVSKNGFTKRETPFLNRFEGGMVYTCGLDSVGGREGYELHGTLHNIPAEIVHASCDESGILVEAIVRDTALFGKNLVLKRKVFAAIGGETVSIEDVLTNAGYQDENYCTLYHINVGYPMMDEGARIVGDVAECRARTPHSRAMLDKVYEVGAPIPNTEETCYFLTLNTPELSVVNDKLGKTLTVSYSADTLPCFVMWKSEVSGDYALGFEPATTELDGGFAYRTLKPAGSVLHRINITVKR